MNRRGFLRFASLAPVGVSLGLAEGLAAPSTARVDLYAQMLKAGFVTKNEVRALENFYPVPLEFRALTTCANGLRSALPVCGGEKPDGAGAARLARAPDAAEVFMGPPVPCLDLDGGTAGARPGRASPTCAGGAP